MNQSIRWAVKLWSLSAIFSEYIWLQIELFNVQFSCEQHAIFPDRDECFSWPHNALHLYIKLQTEHLAMRINYRPFKDSMGMEIKNKSVCLCMYVHACIRLFIKQKQNVRESMGKWLLFGLAPCPLCQKTVKSQIKRFAVVEQFSPDMPSSLVIVCLLDPIQKQYSRGLCRLWEEGHTVSVNISGMTK